ncbi:MAG: hypothetical protein M3X11_21530 [Acidobacteriota bacterium]|nr:hypothetical protein [Acidobacteriota bacterium]
MISDAIEHYHTLLHGSLLSDAIEKLLDGTAKHNLTFSGRPICTVLRPLFINETQYEYIRRDSGLVLSAIQRLGRALMADSHLRAELDLTADEEQIIAIEPGFAAPDTSGRLDAFLDSQGDFHFVEYNADSPGGLLYGDVLSEIFMEMNAVREFAQRFPLRRVDVRRQLLQTLLDSYRQWGKGMVLERPRIAIVDWNEVSTRAEFEISRLYFEAQGCPTIIVDPRELEYRGGWLRAGDFQINLVYKRVVVGELIAQCGLNHPLVRAARERAVCVANSFRVQMMFKKTMFALLDDPAYEHLFSADELASLRRHVPWTRKLRAGLTTYRGRKIDLLDFLVSHREQLVLKPNSDYGGRGVTLGWECDEAKWRQAINDALGASFVVQERVELVQQSFPTLVGDNVKFERRYVDFDPYTWGGEEVEGAGIRLSPSALLNVTAGGGSATPLLIVSG